MTREELQNELHKIGWRITKSGNGLNDFIVNHYNECTSFVVQGDRLEIRNDLFGNDSSLGRGGWHLELSSLQVRSGSSLPRGQKSWVSIGFNEKSFVQFYNHLKGDERKKQMAEFNAKYQLIKSKK